MNQPNPNVKRPKQRQTAQRQPKNAQLALVLRSLLCEKSQKQPSAFADAMSAALGEVSKTNKTNEWNEAKSKHLRNYFTGVLSEANCFINTIIWHYFANGNRRRCLLKVIEESKNKKIKNFWLGGLPGEDATTQYKHIVKIPLDCLGSDSLSKSLQCYFTGYSKDKATFNEMLKMRFLVFFDNDNGFVTGLNRLRTVRNFFQHPEDPSVSLRQAHLEQLTDFVHPIFINLLQGKVMSLAKGSPHEEPLLAAFYQLQKQGQEKRKQARRDFFGIHRTRTEKDRPITRQWEQFQKRWELKKRQWQSRYHLHNFIDQYQRINPQGLKTFALQCASNSKPIKTMAEIEEIAFEEIVLIHRLLSDIDLLLWGYLPDQPAHQGDRVKNNLLKLRNYLAHNHKIGLSKHRNLQTDFLYLLCTASNALSFCVKCFVTMAKNWPIGS